jgi:hypothetical protein
VLLAYEQAPDGDTLDMEIEKLAPYERAVHDHGQGATIIGGAMADRATDRHARMLLRRAVALGRLEPRRALDLGVIEPHELPEAQAIWRR